MRKIASPQALTNELRSILIEAKHPLPSRAAIATHLRTLARRVAANDDAEEHPDLPIKKGEWTLWITKDRATRWSYTLHNPQGGSGGSGSSTSPKAAFSAATSRVKWDGAERVYVVSATWIAEEEKYVVSKQMWVDIPDQGEKGHGVALPMPKLASFDDLPANVHVGLSAPKLQKDKWVVLDASGDPKGRGASLEDTVGAAAQESLRSGKPVKIKSAEAPDVTRKRFTYTVMVKENR